MIDCGYLEKDFILKICGLNFAAFRPVPVLRTIMVLLVAFKNAMECSGKFLDIFENFQTLV